MGGRGRSSMGSRGKEAWSWIFRSGDTLKNKDKKDFKVSSQATQKRKSKGALGTESVAKKEP